jgi:hypothetical protein
MLSLCACVPVWLPVSQPRSRQPERREKAKETEKKGDTIEKHGQGPPMKKRQDGDKSMPDIS